MKITICKECIIPSSKPDLEFNSDGVCQGCLAYKNRVSINWKDRQIQLIKIFKKYKKHQNYDCIIPVSGGKDSLFQVIKTLELGFNPLCITATTDKLTEIGRFNIENLKKMGVDHIEVSTDPIIRRKINKFTLETVGDISWAEHLTIFTIPVKFSCALNIPLIIWGENPQNENGGPIDKEAEINLDRSWLEEFGGLLGLRVTDLTDVLNLEKKKLDLYTYPSEDELKKNKTTGIFLGQFVNWDGHKNAELAIEHGFKCYEKDVEGSIVNYENLDNAQMRVHDYFKYLKYGYDRVTDWCCWHIRRGRLTRDEALKINEKRSGLYPSEYMGHKLDEILKEINCTKDEFNRICDSFTNHQIFKINNVGNLIKKNDGSLIRNF
ncbi:N-acetyl sugar amidotransferase [Candidatus Pelagibacter bacterium]|nr:N-acetyl sugar amidotransferase [Candidatus Pelagibacter bacterium]MDA8844343.1 N-acetyl sugar amidotransferase [Candidatus Pelagibacter bacterium]